MDQSLLHPILYFLQKYVYFHNFDDGGANTELQNKAGKKKDRKLGNERHFFPSAAAELARGMQHFRWQQHASARCKARYGGEKGDDGERVVGGWWSAADGV